MHKRSFIIVLYLKNFFHFIKVSCFFEPKLFFSTLVSLLLSWRLYLSTLFFSYFLCFPSSAPCTGLSLIAGSIKDYYFDFLALYDPLKCFYQSKHLLTMFSPWLTRNGVFFPSQTPVFWITFPRLLFYIFQPTLLYYLFGILIHVFISIFHVWWKTNSPSTFCASFAERWFIFLFSLFFC